MLIAYCAHRYYSVILSPSLRGAQKSLLYYKKKNCKVTKKMYLCMLEYI